MTSSALKPGGQYDRDQQFGSLTKYVESASYEIGWRSGVRAKVTTPARTPMWVQVRTHLTIADWWYT